MKPGTMERLEEALEALHAAYNALVEEPPADGDFFNWARLGIMSSDLSSVANGIHKLALLSVARVPDESK